MKFDVNIKDAQGEWHEEVIDAPNAVTASETGRRWYEDCSIVTTSVHEEKHADGENK